jgi:hypothetical protein
MYVVAEVLVQFVDLVQDSEGRSYAARACGGEMAGGRWQGWIEFIPVDGSGAIRSGRETTQPNRTDTEYWATGLTPVYLEGALERALKPPRPPNGPPIASPIFDGPAEDLPGAPAQESILNPFSVYRKGEALLRNQLAAMSAWHLVNIIQAHDLADDSATLNDAPPSRLIEIIVEGVKRQLTAHG